VFPYSIPPYCVDVPFTEYDELFVVFKTPIHIDFLFFPNYVGRATLYN